MSAAIAIISGNNMIFTVEVPNEGKAHCWFAFDEGDFVQKVRIARNSLDGVIFAMSTPREMLAARGLVPELPSIPSMHAEVLLLADEHGWDTPLYRADYLLAPGLHQAEEVAEFVAHVAAVAHTLKSCRVYLDEEQAMDALYNDPLYAGRVGFYPHMALREQLIALEVLADDL